MKINDIINETASAGSTGAGSVATVNAPLGGMIKRSNPSIYTSKPIKSKSSASRKRKKSKIKSNK